MKVLLSWLREFAPGIEGDPTALGDMLSALGMTVEDMTVTGSVPDGVVLGRVLELRPHPDADRIQLVEVDDGSGKALQVCCGAFNMAVGDLVPLARVGTVLPNGLEIARRKMRGQTSEGMCCSEIELELGRGRRRHHDPQRPGPPPVPGRARHWLTLSAVEPDVLWDLDVGANRPDALSVMGVARDLAAGLGVAFEPPDWSTARLRPETSQSRSRSRSSIPRCAVASSGGCCATRRQGSSPPWMANRLTALGQRPINSHRRHLQLRDARVGPAQPHLRPGEGRAERGYGCAGPATARRSPPSTACIATLAAGDGVIADGDDEAIGIAGVMGGASTEIDDGTTDVLVEMAWWDPPSISRTAKRLEPGQRSRHPLQAGRRLGLQRRALHEPLRSTGRRSRAPRWPPA